MIKIEERLSSKVPIDTSLFISFDYNEQIINTIKYVCEVYNYSKRTREWEVPLTDLSELVDALLPIDDIDFTCLNTPEKSSNEKQYDLTINYKTKPFEHQLDGIRYGLNHNKWLLLDAPGLGKTLQLTYLAEELQKQKGIKHCLIVCGVNILKENWLSEINKHSSLSAMILGRKVSKNGKISYGTVSERAKQLKQPINEFFIITNIETLRSDEVVEAFNHSANQIDLIVVDEVHKCKSSSSHQGANLLKLKSPYQVGATGTLIINSPLDSYVPLLWIDELRSTETHFRDYFCTTRDLGNHKVMILGYKNLELLKDKLDTCSLRRTKDLLNLPEKIYIHEYVEMEDSHRKFYNDIINGLVQDVDKVSIKTKNLLSMMTRLRQAVTCPSALTTSDIIASKIERACDLVEQITSGNDKVIVFSMFKETINILKEQLKDYNPLVITGDTTPADVEKFKDMFQNDNEHKVILATTQKLSVGITLNRANYAIFVDSTWTSADNLQAEDRIHRIGSNKTVFIYYLWCKDTIDESIKQLVSDKSDLSDYIVDDKMSPSMMSKIEDALVNELYK